MAPKVSKAVRRARPASRLKLLAACLAVFTLTVACGLVLPELAERLPSAPQRHGVSVARVIDGDTFVVAGGEHVRILNIDTAEMPPRSRCARERELALEARDRLRSLLTGERVSLEGEGRDRDRYGRLLRRVRTDRGDVGDILVGEGLAQPWRGRRANWC